MRFWKNSCVSEHDNWHAYVNQLLERLTLQRFNTKFSIRDEYSISASLNNHKLVVGAHFDDDLGDDSGSIYLYTYRPRP